LFAGSTLKNVVTVQKRRETLPGNYGFHRRHCNLENINVAFVYDGCERSDCEYGQKNDVRLFVLDEHVTSAAGQDWQNNGKLLRIIEVGLLQNICEFYDSLNLHFASIVYCLIKT